MTEERTSRLPFAIAGLFTGVVAAWVSFLPSGGLDREWLHTGFLALGIGAWVLNLVNRFAPWAFANAVQPRDAATTGAAAGPVDGSRHRLRVLLVSSCLEALSVSLLAAYLQGDILIALTTGVVFGVLAFALSVRRAKSLSAPA